MRQNEAQSVQRGMELLIAFPNSTSFSGHVRLGWDRVGYLKQYLKRLSVKSAAKRILRFGAIGAVADFFYRHALAARLRWHRYTLEKRIGGKVTLELSHSVPAGYGSLWNKAKTQEVISLWKDANYLRWRYDENPDHDFTYFSLVKDEALIALCIAHVHSGEARVSELISADRQVLPARLLLNHVQVDFLARKEVQRLSFAGMDNGFFDEALNDFEKVPAFNAPSA